MDFLMLKRSETSRMNEKVLQEIEREANIGGSDSEEIKTKQV